MSVRLRAQLVAKVMQTDWTQKLSVALRLQPERQDWGICNSDARRLDEFIRFYEANVVDDPWEREALAELIAQSANEAIIDGLMSEQLEMRLVQFFRSRHGEFPQSWEYWTGLRGNPEFPIAALIQRA